MEIRKKEKACGCIIIENNKILLIQQTKGFWGFPKGHVEAGETEIETAKREVKEETNLEVEIDTTKRYTMQYITDTNIDKEVVLFLARRVKGEEKYQASELIDMKWASYKEAMQLLTFDNTKKLLQKLGEEGSIKIS